ncbi:unnamed protein product [Oikopleura dioica]|uniref:Uncharacterized protein n=1 Tax=Oikopleura dioica TaxID=34765 RepID=E4XXK8_OIKDI|nr:unnamed protein product [Oikopleura dioica]CBY38363.1 unnamed protein product [Oikopleura dioica]
MDVYNFANAFRQADVYSMSLVHWELFRMVKELNKGYHFTHELPYQKELAGCRATVSSLLRIVAQSGQRPIIASSFEDTPFGLVLQRIFTEG